MTIPVDFIPDDQFAKARDAALYSIAPGTKTLEAQALDVQAKKNKQDALNAALQLNETKRSNDLQSKYQMGILAETARGNDLDYKVAQGTLANAATEALTATSSTAPTPGSVKADALIADMHAKRSKVSNPATYNYMWHVQRAINQGWWGTLDKADQDRVIKAAQELTGKD